MNIAYLVSVDEVCSALRQVARHLVAVAEDRERELPGDSLLGLPWQSYNLGSGEGVSFVVVGSTLLVQVSIPRSLTDLPPLPIPTDSNLGPMDDWSL